MIGECTFSLPKSLKNNQESMFKIKPDQVLHSLDSILFQLGEEYLRRVFDERDGELQGSGDIGNDLVVVCRVARDGQVGLEGLCVVHKKQWPCF